MIQPQRIAQCGKLSYCGRMMKIFCDNCDVRSRQDLCQHCGVIVILNVDGSCLIQHWQRCRTYVGSKHTEPFGIRRSYEGCHFLICRWSHSEYHNPRSICVGMAPHGLQYRVWHRQLQLDRCALIPQYFWDQL